MIREGNVDVKRLPEDFLIEDASLEQRLKPLCLNVQAWYEQSASIQGQSEIYRAGELMTTYNQLTIPSEELLQVGQQIDDILDCYQGRNLLSMANCAIFWHLNESPAATLGARLYARGAGLNWNPLRMWCELSHSRLQIH